MFRGTTPSLIFKLNTELDFSSIAEVMLTIKKGSHSQTWKSNELSIDADEKAISITLTQKETLAFEDGEAEAQIRILTADGVALATNIVKIDVKRILMGGIIE